MTTITFSRTNDLTAELLLDEIKLELLQPNFVSLVHGKPYAYQKGCRGHLCRYVERTRRRDIRHKEALEKLPNGVRPDTRPRREQRWDPVLACITEHICTEATEDIAVEVNIIEQLGLDSMDKFLSIMKSLRSRQILLPRQGGAPLNT